jgi:hypothetical protein
MYSDRYSAEREEEGRAPSALEVVGLAAFALLQQALFVLVFTEVGFGDDLFRAATPFASVTYTIGWVGVAVLALLFLLDAHFWTGVYEAFALALGLCGLLLIICGLVLIQADYPLLPLAAYCLAVPAAFYSLRRAALGEWTLHRFLALSGIFVTIGGAATLAGWLLWVGLTGSSWSGETTAEFDARVGCDQEANDVCLSGVLLFYAPLSAGLFNSAFGLSCLALATRAVAPAAPPPAGADEAGAGKKPRRRLNLNLTVRVFALCLVLVAAGLYTYTSAYGSSPELADATLFFALAGLVVLSAVAANVIGVEKLQASLKGTPLAKSLTASIGASDVVKALLLVGGWAPVTVYLCLSALKQRLRKAVWLRRGREEFASADGRLVVRRSDWLTRTATGLWELLCSWEWTSVLRKSVWVGIVLVILSLTSALLPVLVAYLRVAIVSAGVPVWAVVLIVTFIGFILFMLPPVPGAGIYYMAPVILTQVMEFYTAIGVSVALSFFLKLFALVIQQKVVGERLGALVSVRSLAMVNSVHTRAVREVLSPPGWTGGKVAVLIGGPDWPTSVLTGILKLNVWSMMAGTTPILVIIVAFVVNGAYLTVRERDQTTRLVYNVSIAVALAVGVGAQLLALHYIVEMVERKRPELEAEPKDPEVEASDLAKAEQARLFIEATRWTGAAPGLTPMPLWVKGTLLLAVVSQIGVTYILGLYQALVFVTFTYADSIEEALGGVWWRIVTFEGRIVLLAWLGSCVLLYVFRAWAKLRVAAYRRAGGGQAQNYKSTTS